MIPDLEDVSMLLHKIIDLNSNSQGRRWWSWYGVLINEFDLFAPDCFLPITVCSLILLPLRIIWESISIQVSQIYMTKLISCVMAYIITRCSIIVVAWTIWWLTGCRILRTIIICIWPTEYQSLVSKGTTTKEQYDKLGDVISISYGEIFTKDIDSLDSYRKTAIYSIKWHKPHACIVIP